MDVKFEVAKAFGVIVGEKMDSGRSPRVSEPRQVAMYLMTRLTAMSLSEVGREFGRTHASVIHGCQATRDRMDAYPEFRRRVEEAEESVRKLGIGN